MNILHSCTKVHHVNAEIWLFKTDHQKLLANCDRFWGISWKFNFLPYFLAHLALPKWAYIIMIHDFITIWDHDLGGISLCGICVPSSWPEYWSHKLHILQVYHIIPLINAHEIFSQYLMYSLTGSHFAQILKMALLSLLLNLEAQYLSQLWIQSGTTYRQEIVYLVYIVLKLCFKSFTFWNFHFPWNLPDFTWNLLDFIHEICQISHEIHQISWNLKSTGFHVIGIQWISCQMSQGPMVLFFEIMIGWDLIHVRHKLCWEIKTMWPSVLLSNWLRN